MTLLYKAFQSSLKSKDGEQKWFPRLAKVGKTVDTQELAEMIARESSLTIGDVHNAIRNLVEVMKQELLDSHSVRLDGLGTFTVISRARGKGESSFACPNIFFFINALRVGLLCHLHQQVFFFSNVLLVDTKLRRIYLITKDFEYKIFNILHLCY
ncbi:hypothetical protein EZS27_024736 [termite gut metagenome]|uniref:Viral histone-like protein n=1 Tax=termite gut metagenome TaxID=433724 RepID=A0A5J4QX43_9ZZZZ